MYCYGVISWSIGWYLRGHVRRTRINAVLYDILKPWLLRLQYDIIGASKQQRMFHKMRHKPQE